MQCGVREKGALWVKGGGDGVDHRWGARRGGGAPVAVGGGGSRAGCKRKGGGEPNGKDRKFVEVKG